MRPRFENQTCDWGNPQFLLPSPVLNSANEQTMRIVAQRFDVVKGSLPPGLLQCFPSPFNPSTQLTFALPTASVVSLIVYDVLGRHVNELAKGYYEAGYHSVTWNASSVASGVYFARLTVANEFGRIAFNKVTKLLLMK
jgi:hypothetical protein